MLFRSVETHLDRLERREQQLMAKAELQEGRLSQVVGGGHHRSASKPQPRRNMSSGNDEKAQRLRKLRQKKERLGYAVERLGLQSQQKQRQLRQSISHAGQDFN